jgi:DNA-binding GntR family transcriptional regulator
MMEKKITPLVEQVSSVIKQEILRRGFTVGHKLPTVAQWAQGLAVSDKTIQKALGLLEKDSLLCLPCRQRNIS